MNWCFNILFLICENCFFLIYFQGLKAIAEVWKNMPVELVPHRQGIYRLKGVDDIFQTLEENLMQLGTMKSTR